jgi:hypothetical protein
MTVAEALQDVEIAFQQIEFALKVSAYWEHPQMISEDFEADLLVQLPEGDLHFPTDHFSKKENILRAAEISVSLTFGASALALDQALKAAGFKVNPESEDAFDQLRCVVYLVRCAFAHGIAAPVWNARKKKLRTYTLRTGAEAVVVDLIALNGSSFSFESLGGHKNWYRIRDAVVQKVEAAQRGDPVDGAAGRP